MGGGGNGRVGGGGGGRVGGGGGGVKENHCQLNEGLEL